MNAARHIVLSCMFLAGMAGPARGQQWRAATMAEMKEFLQRSDRQYTALTMMKLTTSISAYTNSGDAVPGSTGNSTVWRMGDRYKAEHLGFTTVQDKDMKVLIDPEQRMIYLDKPDPAIMPGKTALQDTVMRQAVAIMRSEQADGTHFRLTYRPGAAYESMEMAFDAAGWLRRMELLTGRPVALDPSNPLSAMVKPRIVIAMDRPVAIKAGTVNADPATVVGWRDGRAVGLGAWRDYTVFDTRVP